MEQHGNTTTFNIENVLFQNIQRSLYYKETAELLETADHVIDESYDNVDHIEPWMSGNARGPSTAFCLVYRLGLLKPSIKSVKDMLDHKDSPYIRAVGKQSPLRSICTELHGWDLHLYEGPARLTPSLQFPL
jgi:pre-mRNA-splicing factor 38B